MNNSNYIILLLFVLIGCRANTEKESFENNNSKLTKKQIEVQQSVRDSIVIAHRGMPFHCPESSTPAYILAREIGADYLEADLQRTKDGVLVVFHDYNLQRTTNINSVFPSRINEPISSFSFSELQQLDVGSWFNTSYPQRSRFTYNGLKIITLEDLIDIAKEGTNNPGLYLETKKANQYPGIEKDIFDVLTKCNWLDTSKTQEGNLILQTFEKSSLPLLNKYFPTTPKLFLLWKEDIPILDSVSLKNWVDFGINNGAQFIGPSIYGESTHYPDLMKPWMVKIYKRAGLKIHAYTFDTNYDIRNNEASTSGCFTNRSDLLLDYYDRKYSNTDSILNKWGY
ncbi:MAG: glycerophosphodiester phosphodiesterase [Flavobacteriales bacterium]|nr:glycerophosphodiester phosphodiesterase [Flavobacteriales bacterium]